MNIRKTSVKVVISSHLGEMANEEVISNIHKTIGVDHEVICEENYNEHSLGGLYNKHLEKAKDREVIVFCHPDMLYKTANWGKKLLYHFNDSDYGIIGVAGSTYLSKSAQWWEDKRTLFGIVNHTDGKKEWESTFSKRIPGIQPVVTIDGLFIAVAADRIVHKFDENYGKFHFYDVSFCIPNYLDGVDIGVVTSFRVLHKSVGETNKEWEENRIKFAEEYKDELPIVIDPKYNDIDIKLDKYPRVSVIIPTKNNYDILYENIMSWNDLVNYPNFEIIIADTGSDSEVKKKYDKILDDRVRLVEYDYYNFGQINNDVVQNHTTEKSELVLFCNDDVELLNDALTRCVEVYNKNHNIGTIGIRLHFGNSLVQHCGVFYREDGKGALHLGHIDIGKSRDYDTGVNYKAHGNTAAFMMINRELFIDLGCFNERYIECFEDVELNFKCLIEGKKNITVCDAVSFHYESLSRNKDPKKLEKLQTDYEERLFPFYRENKIALRKYLRR